jgi:hypothetical protein
MAMKPLLLLCLALTGCATVRPSIVTWGVPDPSIPATIHAERIYGVALRMLPTGSMEPFLTGGDYIVGDFSALFGDMKNGWLVLYDATGDVASFTGLPDSIVVDRVELRNWSTTPGVLLTATLGANRVVSTSALYLNVSAANGSALTGDIVIFYHSRISL